MEEVVGKNLEIFEEVDVEDEFEDNVEGNELMEDKEEKSDKG